MAIEAKMEIAWQKYLANDETSSEYSSRRHQTTKTFVGEA